MAGRVEIYIHALEQHMRYWQPNASLALLVITQVVQPDGLVCRLRRQRTSAEGGQCIGCEIFRSGTPKSDRVGDNHCVLFR